MISFEKQADQAAKNDAISFGRAIRAMREGKEITLRELASQIGLNYTMLSQIEQGEIVTDSVILLLNLSEALDVPLLELIKLRYAGQQLKNDGTKDMHEWEYKQEALAEIEKSFRSASYSREELHIICELISAYSSAKSTTP